MSLNFKKAEVVSLKNHPDLDEKWLQGKISSDPSLLGLDSELEVKELERRHAGAGRLDLLLSDREQGIRYEVEIQLGSTDPEHIIRTIEYWDIEKSRFPQYEHVAVIVAEDITNRFLNVIALFNKSIPLIAIEMKALRVGSVATLHSTRVLDLRPLGTEEEDSGQQTDRNYWLSKRGTKSTVGMADDLLKLIKGTTGENLELNYTKHYIGLARDGVANNFIQMRPRKVNLLFEPKLEKTAATSQLIEESGVETGKYNSTFGRYVLRLTPGDLETQRDLLVSLIEEAYGMPELPSAD